MKAISFLVLLSFAFATSYSQKDPDRARLYTKAQPVTLYEHGNFAGQTKSMGIGQFLLSDFNDLASSIKVAAGFCAVIYEHADAGGGYGISVDLMEDRHDLSAFNFNDKASYVIVFSTIRPGYTWVRNAIVNGQFIAGHWERERARPLPPNTVAVVSPSRPPNVTTTAVATAMQVNGPTTTITTLGNMQQGDKVLWDKAYNLQSGIYGNDFRGREELGSACFQRASNNAAIPDNINFWYLQKDSRDHRGFFKRTLSGKVAVARQVNIAGTFADYDINIDIEPLPEYMDLLTRAHPREYTTIMRLQYEASKVSIGNILTKPIWQWESSSGQADCGDEVGFKHIEAEIAPEYWPQGNHTFGRSAFADMCLIRTGKNICVYGPWIYDMGHCCHPEIHPAEQVWWSEPQSNGVKYNLNVFCDASRRFWWRKQMDDGTKLRPWAAPPIKGLFAIAFEVPLDQISAFGQVTKKFEVSNVEHYNVIEYPNADQTYNLQYQGKTLVSFIPHNNAFKVSFENVGLSPAGNAVRGFLVLETSVGTVTQVATSIYVAQGGQLVKVTIPPNSDPDKVDQRYEDKFFKKEDGRYMFSILQTSVTNRPANEAGRIN